MSLASKKLAKEGEDLAVALLIEKGYQILERNYNYEKKGEIDIVVKDPETGYLVFVEVKSRQNLEYGEPEYAMTKNKILQVKKMAEIYLFDKEISEIDCRFDVVTVLFRSKIPPIIKHYVNAF
jgi:putative endonuclease